MRECNMICPKGKTPRSIIKLSRLDMLVRTPYSHTTLIYIYHPQGNNNNFSTFFDTQILKDSLSRVLVPFYPLAGRLRKNKDDGAIEIDCNAQGVLFVEIQTSLALTNFKNFKSNIELRKMVIPTCDYSKGLSSFPLFMVQFTRFKCGGVCMGVATHHHVNDGSAYAYFMSSWARLARGLQLLVLPVHNRSAIYQFTVHDPTQVKFRHLEFEPSLPPTVSLGKMGTSTEGFFTLSKSLINALKQEATPKQLERSNLSTFEIVAAHVWRTTCKVRGLAPDQDVKLYIPIDGRSRLQNPNPPKGYYGNLVFFTACIAKSRDITCNPLGYAATKIKEALQRMRNEEYIKSALNFLETFPKDDPMVVLNGPESITSPNLIINSWAKLPLYETDFGWGNPIFGGTGGVKYEGLSFLVPNRDGGFSLSINLFKDHMPLFEKCLYDFKIISTI